MAQLRTWQDVEALGPTEAEQRLIAACKAGEPCVLGDGSRPEAADPARTIRAGLLRYLILGGCEDCRVAEAGVRLEGAWVAGQLDLSWASARGPVGLFACGFAEQITAMQAHLPALALNGSALPGLFALEVHVSGNVLLLDGFHASGAVILVGARIGGQLTCERGRFDTPKGKALDAQSAQVTGGVFLRDGFHATGAVSLAGARIGGQLECDGGWFDNAKGIALDAQGAQVTGAVFLRDGFHASGEVRLSGARIGGQLDCTGGRFGNTDGNAFNGQGMRVEGSFIWRRVTVEKGVIRLSAARVGDLVDHPESWPGGGRVPLDGFIYDRIVGSFTDARRRLAWLAKCDTWKDEFFPQPYTQLARVLRAMGHDRAARDVLVARERRLRAHARARARIVPDGSVRAGLLSIWRDLTNICRWLWDILQRATIGYGHKPERSLVFLLVLITIATFLAHRAWQAGDFAPASDVILTSPGWQALAGAEANPAQAWSAADGPGRDWESFNRYAFAADVVIPIIDFGQTQAWAPSTTRGPWGWHLWWARWLLSGLGWIVTALGAAAVTGIIQRERE